MRARTHDRAILALALPALGALAADPLVSLIDTAFVGRLGPLPLAALGVNVAVFTFVFVAFNFLAYGTTPMVAAARGRGDHDAAGRTVAHAFAIAAGAGIAALALLTLLAEPVLRLMGADDALLAPATGYLRIRALAGPALLLITAANGAFRGFQDTRTPFVVSLGVAATNLVLDPLFIFTLGWGLEGAAWATVAAQWAGAVAFVALVYGPRRRAWRVPLALPTPRALVPFARVGVALLVRTLALLATLTAATAVAARAGVVEVAAHQVAAQLWLFLALVIDALAIAAQALVARYVGEGRPADARAVADRLLAMGLDARRSARRRHLAVGSMVAAALHRRRSGAGGGRGAVAVRRRHAAAERARLRVGRGVRRAPGLRVPGAGDGPVRRRRRRAVGRGAAARLGSAGRLVGARRFDGGARAHDGVALPTERARVRSAFALVGRPQRREA
jgi:putative MATE family efflux protein